MNKMQGEKNRLLLLVQGNAQLYQDPFLLAVLDIRIAKSIVVGALVSL